MDGMMCTMTFFRLNYTGWIQFTSLQRLTTFLKIFQYSEEIMFNISTKCTVNNKYVFPVETNYFLKVHNVHVKLASPISGKAA